MEYKIVKAKTPETLERKVNELMSSGWVPLGGPIKPDGADSCGAFVWQAMLKQESRVYLPLVTATAGGA